MEPFNRNRAIFFCEACAAKGPDDGVRVVIDVTGDGAHSFNSPLCPVCRERGEDRFMKLRAQHAHIELPGDLVNAPHVVISTCLRDPMVTLAYHQSVCRAERVLRRAGIVLSQNVVPGGAIQYARNRLESTFRKRTAGTHLLFVDDDVRFDADDLVRMVRADKDVIAGVYATREIDWRAVAAMPRDAEQMKRGASPLAFRPLRDAQGRVTREGDLIEAEFVPTGFLLIKRAVLERMILAYPELAYHAPEDDETQYACFEAQVIDGRPFTEDFVWSHRWRAIGGRIWVDGRATFGHNGSYEFVARSPIEQLEASARRVVAEGSVSAPAFVAEAE
jgi:hypothetical protein